MKMKVMSLAKMVFAGMLLAILLQGAGADDGQNATVNLTFNQSSGLDENMSANDSQVQSAVISLGSGNRNAGKALRTGFQEKKRGAGLPAGATLDLAESKSAEEQELARPKLFAFNLLLTVAVIAMLIWDVFPSYVPFMLGVSVALFVNYGATAKMHKKIINLHAGPALMMCSTLMGAAVLMGVLTTSFVLKDGKMVAASAKVMEVDLPSVVRCLAGIIEAGLPTAVGQHLPLVIGVLSVPLALAFDTDSYFFGMLPVIIAIGQSFGVDALPIAVAMVVCRNCATFISPVAPATYLGIGLAGVEIKDHIKYCFGWQWGVSIVCLVAGLIMGVIQF